MGKTIKDVAGVAGVSTATVSRVLMPGNCGRVAEKTRNRVITAAQMLGYRTNHVARSLKLHSTMTVGVVFPELANDFFMDVAEGIEKELHAEGYTMLLSSSRNSIEEAGSAVQCRSNRFNVVAAQNDGIDATGDAIASMKRNEMVATVLQDAIGQSTTAFDVIYQVASGTYKPGNSAGGIPAATKPIDEAPANDASIIDQCYLVPFVPVDKASDYFKTH